MITISDVKKIYQSKAGPISAVDGVNLSVKEGEIFGVIGYSGAGKSTLIRMLNGLEVPTEGTINVGGQAVSTIKGKKLREARQSIGMIFQHFNLLWSRTVIDNIQFPLEIAGVPKKERVNRANELLTLVGLEGRGDAYPAQLSGGQKQRVGIARALANNPRVLLCDEATSALDPQTTDSILDLLVDINKRLGLTIVLITHEMHVIKKICHRVAVMENGKVAELGDVLEVFRNPQQQVTKRFVKEVSQDQDSDEVIEQLIKEYPTGKVLKFTFVGDSTGQPLITSLIRKFDLEVNILQGQISQTQKGAYGTLFVHLDGEESQLKEALTFAESQLVKVEVMAG
ncbi:methionine ABC transporter ATP-binding protein [[Bacillus] enclensis]|uniref:D-methionine transport system ATP-binding protein n=1 Tax=[Bacillus] enclensis TaxID=1402860 RepID=A0A0V8H889_9BACI|nr:methionine ABC transporter ATP-binding protein [[Bacillus] enclensis]KSU58674.1 methionine ABC transporter ATP-binding protein [[Bacillus] enclensis]SCC32866.1 D-methionine transport system ATP-binding protein [[Bacillus] enclensis]